ncbi:preprotein translocase subunit SecG [Entomobacter blattae]|uniref:Protein-export membrane protein SecG n=1 Tax=Entomobacter blattae TaxID=2762277 RepID=A0A7H1NSF2_9PROT|nr:preprotein translocase subunit SecG [Entomobacter blattae]QNT78712.1 Protein-export membrane protein SecG [Entomobacter blattae]
MITFLLILHLLVTLSLIAVVLIQRSEGGGLGIGSGQGLGSFMTGRGTANLLTRSTAILAALFMILSLALAIVNKGGIHGGNHDVLAHPDLPALPAPLPNQPPAPAAAPHTQLPQQQPPHK